MIREHAAPLLLAVAVALLAACAELQQQPPTPQPAAPQITENVLRERAVQQLALGVKQYDSGDYENAVKTLSASLDHGLLSKADQSRARKYLAFTHCVSNREPQCRDEFRKAFEINPGFALTQAEDGHPIWGPVYRDVRAKLISEREATMPAPLFAPKLGKAEQALQDGMTKYDAGDYAQAHRLLEEAVAEGLKEKKDHVKALKHAAFSLCLQKKWRDCRATFIRIYDVDPDFDLAPAEAGHPEWRKTFAAAKAQAKRALEQKAAKDKARTPPAATVPTKK